MFPLSDLLPSWIWIPITAVYFHACCCSEISLAFNGVFGKSLLLQHWHNKSFYKKLAFLKVLLSPNVFILCGSNKIYQKEAEMRFVFPLHHSSKRWNILVWRVEHEWIILHSGNIFSTQSFFSHMNLSTLSACLTVCLPGCLYDSSHWHKVQTFTNKIYSSCKWTFYVVVNQFLLPVFNTLLYHSHVSLK